MSKDAFDVVRIYDPVLAEHCDRDTIGEYALKRDLALLDMPKDAKPMYFHCRLLKRSEAREVRRTHAVADQQELAALIGMVSISNVPDENGRAPRTLMLARDGRDRVIDDALDDADLRSNDLAEIGSVIIAKSFLGRGEELSCEPPATSLRAFAVMVTRHAERRNASKTATGDGGESDQTNEPPSEQPPTPPAS